MTDFREQSLWIGGASLAALELAGAFGTLFGGSISDKLGRKTIMLISCITAPILLLIFLHVDDCILIPVIVVLGLFQFATSPVLLAYVQEIDSERPAFVNSLYMTINFGLGAFTVLAIGALSDYIGMDLTFKIAAFVAFGSIPFLLLLPSKK